MNEILQNTPFLISAGAALLFLCFWGLASIKSRERNRRIEELVEEYCAERTARVSAEKDCLRVSERGLEYEKIVEGLNAKIEQYCADITISRESRSWFVKRVEKLEFILKKVHPAIYDDKRLDAWIERLKNPEKKNGHKRPSRTLPGVTREVKAAAGTAREIKGNNRNTPFNP